MSIKVEFGRNVHGKPDAMRAAVDSLAGQIAIAMVRVIRRRVQTDGRPAETPPPYSRRRGWYSISPRYAVQPAPTGEKNGRVRSDGAAIWASSADYHAAAAVKRGSYSVTGGMWDGLTAVLRSSSAAVAQFRGRSEGQRAIHSGPGKRAKGRKIPNALKASSVLRYAGIGLLELTEEEWDELGRAVSAWVAQGIDGACVADIAWSGSLDTSFLRGR